MSEGNHTNHPDHYFEHTSLECIEVMELIFGHDIVEQFCVCNAFKYMWRYKLKNGVEDLNKADWYLNYISETRENDWFPDHYDEIRKLLDSLIEEASD